MSLAFVASPLDRNCHLRLSEDVLRKLRNDSASRLVRVTGDSVLMADGELVLDHQGIDQRAVFLGLDPQGTGWFATGTEASETAVGIRAIMVDGLLDQPTLSLLAQARSLVGWHDKHGFCANCGTKTAMADAGYRRICPSCKVEHFPRTDPVVIMAVRKGDHHLLGRQASWPPHMYSALAGFMEPGETIEQAVRREVLEETAIEVADVSYVASQPWPFPSSIMIGMIGEAVTDDIVIDPKELEAACWFSEEELKLMLAGKHPEGLWASRPQAIAHTVLTAALKT
jgi:NAD+ diphosphatase